MDNPIGVPQNYTLLRRYLLFPTQVPPTQKDDRLVIALPREHLNRILKNIYRSPWIASDKRKSFGMVGFIPIDFYTYPVILQELLWQKAIVEPKNEEVDKREDLAKIVIYFCLKAKNSEKYLFVSRQNKKILRDVLALGLMKSLSFDVLKASYFYSQKYRINFSVTRLSENSPSDKIRFDFLNYIGEEGIFPSLNLLNPEKIKPIGIVAGGKDVGLVYKIICEDHYIEQIARDIGGIVFDAENYSYEEVKNFYNLRTDGWSEAVLQYLCKEFRK
jgi:hypothetical protein